MEVIIYEEENCVLTKKRKSFSLRKLCSLKEVVWSFGNSSQQWEYRSVGVNKINKLELNDTRLTCQSAIGYSHALWNIIGRTTSPSAYFISSPNTTSPLTIIITFFGHLFFYFPQQFSSIISWSRVALLRVMRLQWWRSCRSRLVSFCCWSPGRRSRSGLQIR